METDKESWATIIRACVISSKEPLTPDEIKRDIKLLDGKNIPFKQLKYNSMIEMLKDIDGLKVFRSNGQTLVKAIANAKTDHIQKMVNLQKKSKIQMKRLNSSSRFDNEQPIENRPKNTRKRTKASLNRPINQEQDTVFPTNGQQFGPPQLMSVPLYQLLNQQQWHQLQQFSTQEYINLLALQPFVQLLLPLLLIDPQLLMNNCNGVPTISFIPYLHMSQQPSYPSNRF